jgi:hypothetical protein
VKSLTVRDLIKGEPTPNEISASSLGMFLGVAACVREGLYKSSRPDDVQAVFTRLLEIESDYQTECEIVGFIHGRTK